jgi:hypothetical protein
LAGKTGRIAVQGELAQKDCSLHLQNNQIKMDLRCGSSGRFFFASLNSNPSPTKKKKKDYISIKKE